MDLLKYFNIDLVADLGHERLSWRRLELLLEALPVDSETSRAIYGDRVRWSDTEHLLATIIDLLQTQIYLTQLVNSPKNKKPERPQPIDRPGFEAPTKTSNTRTSMDEREIAQRLINQRRREQAQS